MARFETHRYSSIKRFAHIKVFDEDRLIAIVRQPPKTIPMVDGLQGEQPDHWRVDCDADTCDPVDLKEQVKRHLGTDKVSVFSWHKWSWKDQQNTEAYEPIEGELQKLSF